MLLLTNVFISSALFRKFIYFPNKLTGLVVPGASRCYYNFQHYEEGDRIVTNEPCLNCTCHKRMLMCYLRVCPFTKAVGQDCTVEKRPDQCCPVITCPQGTVTCPSKNEPNVMCRCHNLIWSHWNFIKHPGKLLSPKKNVHCSILQPD